MRGLAPLCIAILFAACAKTENQAADTGMPAVVPAAEPEAAPAAIPMSLKEVAGTYTMTGKLEGSDSTLLTYELNTTDTTGWTIKFADRKTPEKVRIVSVGGDSIVTEAGPYKSFVRKGVTVSTNAVFRMRDGKLVSRTVAHYDVKTPDSVRVIIAEGVRK